MRNIEHFLAQFNNYFHHPSNSSLNTLLKDTGWKFDEDAYRFTVTDNGALSGNIVKIEASFMYNEKEPAIVLLFNHNAYAIEDILKLIFDSPLIAFPTGRGDDQGYVVPYFYNAWKSISGGIISRFLEIIQKTSLANNASIPIYVTGHSIAGAIATFAALAIATELPSNLQWQINLSLFTYAAPAVGENSFMYYFDKVLNRESPYDRFTTKFDQVVNLVNKSDQLINALNALLSVKLLDVEREGSPIIPTRKTYDKETTANLVGKDYHSIMTYAQSFQEKTAPSFDPVEKVRELIINFNTISDNFPKESIRINLCPGMKHNDYYSLSISDDKLISSAPATLSSARQDLVKFDIPEDDNIRIADLDTIIINTAIDNDSPWILEGLDLFVNGKPFYSKIFIANFTNDNPLHVIDIPCPFYWIVGGSFRMTDLTGIVSLGNDSWGDNNGGISRTIANGRIWVPGKNVLGYAHMTLTLKLDAEVDENALVMCGFVLERADDKKREVLKDFMSGGIPLSYGDINVGDVRSRILAHGYGPNDSENGLRYRFTTGYFRKKKEIQEPNPPQTMSPQAIKVIGICGYAGGPPMYDSFVLAKNASAYNLNTYNWGYTIDPNLSLKDTENSAMGNHTKYKASSTAMLVADIQSSPSTDAASANIFCHSAFQLLPRLNIKFTPVSLDNKPEFRNPPATLFFQPHQIIEAKKFLEQQLKSLAEAGCYLTVDDSDRGGTIHLPSQENPSNNRLSLQDIRNSLLSFQKDCSVQLEKTSLSFFAKTSKDAEDIFAMLKQAGFKRLELSQNKISLSKIYP